MKLQCYIVDDEPPAIRVLENHAEKIDRLEIIDTFTNPVEAIQKLQERPVDLLFLDIKMPKLTGIDFINVLPNPPKVIFTTAYREYALEGFELDVVDYLLKPISFQRFLKAVNKIARPDESGETHTSSASQSIADKHLYVQVNNEHIKIRLSEITHIESSKNKVKFFTEGGRHILARQTLTSVNDRLPDTSFIRIHRSFIVSIPKIQRFTATKVIAGDVALPIGRTYKLQVLKRLKNDHGLPE